MSYLCTPCQISSFGFCTSDMNAVLEIKWQNIPLQIWYAVHFTEVLSFLGMILTLKNIAF